MQITAIYTSPEGALQVRQMLSRLNSDMTHGIQFQLRLWRGDVLHMPEVYALARNDAASSMLLMIICEGQSLICPEVETITDEWCETHADSEAALACFATTLWTLPSW
ncbi:MAG: hypothetical protein HC901_01895 [Bdellovibrionaceae bacterium]|nr:hypothetical protein [Pseudobdellovibrionaceae bacterium]